MRPRTPPGTGPRRSRTTCRHRWPISPRGLVGLAASTIRFFPAGGEGVHMWHEMFVEQFRWRRRSSARSWCIPGWWCGSHRAARFYVP